MRLRPWRRAAQLSSDINPSSHLRARRLQGHEEDTLVAECADSAAVMETGPAPAAP